MLVSKKLSISLSRSKNLIPISSVHFFSDSRFSDTANACQKYAHLYTLSEIFFWSERFTSLAAKSIARNERRFFLAE